MEKDAQTKAIGFALLTTVGEFGDSWLGDAVIFGPWYYDNSPPEKISGVKFFRCQTLCDYKLGGVQAHISRCFEDSV